MEGNEIDGYDYDYTSLDLYLVVYMPLCLFSNMDREGMHHQENIIEMIMWNIQD